MSLPKFELNKVNLSEDEFAKATTSSNSKGFGPGNYDLVIKNVQYHKNRESGEITCSGDKTWINVSMELHGADGRMKKYWLQVPFKKHTYTSNGKEITFPFQKLVKFMAAVGEPLTPKNLGDVIDRYFSTEAALSNLEGAEVNVDIGFKGPYVKFAGENDFRIMIDGQEYSEGSGPLDFPDADSAIAFAAANLNKNLARWPEILRFNPGEVRQVEDKQQADEGW